MVRLYDIIFLVVFSSASGGFCSRFCCLFAYKLITIAHIVDDFLLLELLLYTSLLYRILYHSGSRSVIKGATLIRRNE